MIPLTKTLNPEKDYTTLAEECALVDAVGVEGQHTHRRFEYALALHALAAHRPADAAYHVLDVGGAGSPFSQIVDQLPWVACEVIDPKVNADIEGWPTATPVDAVISISTIEHVRHPTPFLRAIHRALKPGGLLFLTMDCWNCEGPDTAHFHWMRERIYNKASWQDLAKHATLHLGFKRFGTADYTYHGNFVWDYSFCSLALVKES
jgi:SAM-dependent methyltransferase